MQWRTKAHCGAVTSPAVTIMWDSPLAFLQGLEDNAQGCLKLYLPPGHTVPQPGVEATFQGAGWCAHQLCAAAAPCSIYTL